MRGRCWLLTRQRRVCSVTPWTTISQPGRSTVRGSCWRIGGWLRRHRRQAESRPVLRAAIEAFDALGTVSWGDRAREELRASGETSRRRSVASWDQLSAQELQIAQMAANGLSNRDIGQRLYVSHRTVGSHLYRVYPKLGYHVASSASSGPQRPSPDPELTVSSGQRETGGPDLDRAADRCGHRHRHHRNSGYRQHNPASSVGPKR